MGIDNRIIFTRFSIEKRNLSSYEEQVLYGFDFLMYKRLGGVDREDENQKELVLKESGETYQRFNQAFWLINDFFTTYDKLIYKRINYEDGAIGHVFAIESHVAGNAHEILFRVTEEEDFMYNIMYTLHVNKTLHQDANHYLHLKGRPPRFFNFMLREDYAEIDAVAFVVKLER